MILPVCHIDAKSGFTGPDERAGKLTVRRPGDHLVRAPVKARVVVFGNAAFERGADPRALSWWFARAVSECHFCWSAEMDEDYIRAHSPDWVICQTTERFLPQLPAR